MSKSALASLRITLLYVLFAGLWIVFSDRALEAGVSSVRLLTELQTLKGWVFIAITATLLFVLLLRTLRTIEHIYQLDPLTGLLNHDMFKSQLDKKLQQCTRDQAVVVIYLDIDRFAAINQRLGFERADQLLHDFSRRLKSQNSASTLLGRFPPDQFAIALLADNNPLAIELSVAQVKTLFAQASQKYRITATCSVGVALGPDDGDSAKTLMSAAAQTLARAKQWRQDGFAFFSRELSELELQKQRLLKELRQALDSDSLALVYQPQYCIDTRALTGVEVLIRWKHPQQGFISPDVFIPLAEENGLSERISAFVVARADAELRQSGLLGGVIRRVSINISALEFNNQESMTALLDHIARAQTLRPWLQLEITETATLTDIEKSAGIIRTLKQSGLRFSIDDFGTGYTSLAMLKDLPIDEIKIDRSFINDLSHDSKAHIIIGAMIAMTRNFGVNVVAEGIETEAQLELLKALGCHEAQGYLLAVPMDIRQLGQQIGPVATGELTAGRVVN
jgi:diguanylate cyclase (GGDEF)-like protein